MLKADGIVNRLWKMLSTIFWVAVAGTMFTVSIVSNFGLLQLIVSVLFINYNAVWKSKHENGTKWLFSPLRWMSTTRI